MFITLRPRFKYEKSTHRAGNMVARAGGLQKCISAYDKLLLRTVNSAIYLFIAQDCSGLAGGCAGGWIQAEVACTGERESER